ncbi:transcriptional regulator [Shewanella sp. Scap07]|uniref:ChrR family anti-sigma-E factor n=1 Tax=Shewanella sp. Scap07 TaxID=2589987 RepID=UPI0015B7E714|nr:ChrR family anti-sigma-E factor [Shewanella sp. Scap07]QLE85145.1 transcriptional regulator [Shewanella sp. Scap07]
MINHHPKNDILTAFVSGQLPASVSVVVASHVELCEHCQQQVELITAQQAASAFNSASDNALIGEAPISKSEIDELDMIDMITALEPDTASVETAPVEVAVNNKLLTLPSALRQVGLKEWQGLGKLSRARFDLDDDEMRMSLLHIDKGGSVPTHTHKGFEVTLLLEGSFDDEMGHYSVGDFIWLDGEHTHQPVTQEGCVCLTVSSDAIHFTQGVSQILNPIGRFIY